MGTLRKMGAFLGLVPDESELAEHGRSERRGDRWDADRYGHDDYGTAGHGADPEHGYADPYGAEPGEEQFAADHAEGWSGRPAELDHHAGWSADADEAGTDPHGLPPYAEPAYGAVAGGHDDRSATATATRPRSRRREAVAVAERPTARQGRDAARDTDTDFRTQGALAVQPEAAVEAATDTAGAKPATVSLSGFADAREVGELYRAGQAVILDMTELTDAEARRMVDFAAGLAFAVRGSIDKVTTKVFMLHPPSNDEGQRGR